MSEGLYSNETKPTAIVPFHNPNHDPNTLPTESAITFLNEAVSTWRDSYIPYFESELKDQPFIVEISDQPNLGYVLPIRLIAKSTDTNLAAFKESWKQFVHYMETDHKLLLPDEINPSIHTNSSGLFITDLITFYPPADLYADTDY